MEDSEGPFAGYHGVVPPCIYLVTCEGQACEGMGDPCPSFQGYATACQAAGSTLWERREAMGCPLTCPAKSHYQLCAHTCEHTCAGLSALPLFSECCFEGCQCAEGLLFDRVRYLLPGTCGCLHQGRYFQIAETMMTPDCSQSCSCWGPGGLQCHPFTCPFGHTCGLHDGTCTCTCIAHPGCCILSPATCFVTFDGITGPTLATGTDVVARMCDPWDPAWFQLRRGHQGHWGAAGSDGTSPLHPPQLHCCVEGQEGLELPGPLTITETHTTLQMSRIPGFLVELGATGVTVEVPREAQVTLCGLCGDYNGATSNDLRGPDGTVTSDVRALAEAWRAHDFTQ
ncbi:IgGFc-binding protein-like isoform X2 [Catharus ustulatus]|nr:IgGFc-binding protein-like isoform X2 [Catharus ustulatus]